MDQRLTGSTGDVYIVYTVYGRGRNHDWTPITNLRPKSEEEAQQKVDACRRSQPMWEFKWEKQTWTTVESTGPTGSSGDDSDIPF